MKIGVNVSVVGEVSPMTWLLKRINNYIYCVNNMGKTFRRNDSYKPKSKDFKKFKKSNKFKKWNDKPHHLNLNEPDVVIEDEL